MGKGKTKDNLSTLEGTGNGRSLFFYFQEEKPFNLAKEVILEKLGTTLQGLSQDEVTHRLEKYGPNQLAQEEPISFVSRIICQLKEALVLILIGAAVISGLLGEHFDALVIMAIVILNALLGAIQESRAEASLQALQELTKPFARVVRHGEEKSLPAAELVPGDLVYLEAGAQIPADLRLMEATELRVNEAALTGEPIPVDKTTEGIHDEPPLAERTNMAYMGTTVAAGRGKGIVVATGMYTELGNVAQLIKNTPPPPTPLQKRLAQLGRFLGLAAVILVSMVFFIGLWRGEPFYEMFLVSVSLAVAVIPEGLPAIATVTLALGVQKMQKRKAIIRKLPAVETLGTATVICSDKTGTLTQNKMTMCRAYLSDTIHSLGDGQTLSNGELFLQSGVLANDAQLPNMGDPTELALLWGAQEQGLDIKELRTKFPRLREIAFTSKRKMMTTLHKWQTQLPWAKISPYLSVTKGAPDMVLPLCKQIFIDDQLEELTEERKTQIEKANETLASGAYRVLAIAVRPLEDELAADELEKDLICLGLVGLVDPPRPEVKDAIKDCSNAGIRTIMITGDSPVTAQAIAQQLEMSSNGKTLTGPQLEKMDMDELIHQVQDCNLFARVSPHHKLKIIEALQANNHVVAMTGDGINDAPALKKADIGAAMGITGTDVAREASDLVLADDNFATIVAAIAQGRTIYSNIRKAIHYLLSCNMGELAVIVLAILFGLGRPLSAIQILWINLVTDGFPALALSVEPDEKGIMNRPPRPPKQGIFADGLGERIALHGTIVGLLTLWGYVWALNNYDYPTARTTAFMVLAFSQLVHAFNARSLDRSLFAHNLGSNPLLYVGVLVSLVLQLSVLLIPAIQPIFNVVPVSTQVWNVVIILSFLPLPLVELGKAIWPAPTG